MQFNRVFIHCSGSEYGSALMFDAWHRARGWSSIGYHFIISNGLYSAFQRNRWEFAVGSVEAGRYLDDDSNFTPKEEGAHVYGFNSGSVGACIIGGRRFAIRQYKSAKVLVLRMLDLFNLTVDDVFGHYEAGQLNPKYATEKTCPNIPMDAFRDYLRDSISVEVLDACVKSQVAKGFEDIHNKTDKAWYANWLVKNSEKQISE